MARRARVVCAVVALTCGGGIEALAQPCGAIPSAPCAAHNGTTFDGGDTFYCDTSFASLGSWTPDSSLGSTACSSAGAGDFCGVQDVDCHGQLLEVRPAADPAKPGYLKHTQLKKSLPLVAGMTNIVVEIEFWDGKSASGALRDYGVGFYVCGTTACQGELLGVYIDNAAGNPNDVYRLYNGGTWHDTGVRRTEGWHTLQIFVTEVGTYAAIDGRSLASLRGITDGKQDGTYFATSSSFPVRSSMKSAAVAVIEVPSWKHAAGEKSWWDNFKVYRVRTAQNTTGWGGRTWMTANILAEAAGRYDAALFQPGTSTTTALFNSARSARKSENNFALATIGLAAAFGVRATLFGAALDWSKCDVLLQQVADDYPSWGAGHSNEAPLATHAVALLASWRWPSLAAALQKQVKDLLKDQAAAVYARPELTPGASFLTGFGADNICTGGPCTACNSNMNNSGGEQRAWHAALLYFAQDFLKNDAAYCGGGACAAWEQRAIQLACTATSVPAGCGMPTASCEIDAAGQKALSAIGTTHYLYIDHGMVHPSYALTLPLEFAAATVLTLNTGGAYGGLPGAFTKNLGLTQLTKYGLLDRVRTDNFTYVPFRAEDKVLVCTGRDDWNQDATLQDAGWAYLEGLINSPTFTMLTQSVGYVWLTRAVTPYNPRGTAFGAAIDGIASQWMLGTVGSCSAGTYSMSVENDAKDYFLNGMDALDRFMVPFLLYWGSTANPTPFKLHRAQATVPPPDAGGVKPDAGGVTPDAGGVKPDGVRRDGPLGLDRGGVLDLGDGVRPDAPGDDGARRDAGADGGSRSLAGGCGCSLAESHAGGAPLILLVLVAVAEVARRRRRSWST